MDRKPDDGCEIQNSCDGRSGIMMRLKLVKTATEEERDANERQDAYGYEQHVVLLLANYICYLLSSVAKLTMAGSSMVATCSMIW